MERFVKSIERCILFGEMTVSKVAEVMESGIGLQRAYGGTNEDVAVEYSEW